MNQTRERVSLEYPVDVRMTLRLSKEGFAEALKMLAAVKLYELGKISSGKAAALAGVDRATFLLSLGPYRAPVFNYAPEEVEREIADARARSRRPMGLRVRLGEGARRQRIRKPTHRAR